MNMQPWEFILVTDRNRLQELSKVWRSGGHIASSAATVAVLAPQANDPREEAIHEFDLGQAAMSMMIAAADLGIGSCHSAVGDQDLARKVLGHPADRRCALLISLGYPADRPLKPIRSPKRRPIDQVIRRGHW
jgi:nitroreductase